MMDGLYEFSKSKRVASLESELEKELKDLQATIEDGSFLRKIETPQSVSSVPIPKDVKYFRNERKIAIQNMLQVPEAKQLENQAEVMMAEMESCLKYEYSKNSLPLLLHQFFVSRIKELIICKHMHMLRWSRFCEHTKAMEKLYPEYRKRMKEIMDEYHDALQRAQRLSECREALLMDTNIPTSIVQNEDLVIYTRWIVCHFHSIKKLKHFMKVIQWIPQSHLQNINLADKVGPRKIVNSLLFDGTTRECSSYNVLHPILTKHYSNPSAEVKQRTSSMMKWKETIKNKIITKLKNDIPVLSMNLTDFSKQLNFLLTYFHIEMEVSEIDNQSDEMDMLNFALRKFKQIHFQQEQSRKYETYDLVKDQEDSSVKEENLIVYKKEANWLNYIQIKPAVDQVRLTCFSKLKENNHLDEIMLAQAKFLKVESSDRVLYLLREYMKETEYIRPSLVTSSRRRTQDMWTLIFNFSLSGKASKDDFLEFDAKIDDEPSNQEEYDITPSIQKLGVESDDIKKHPITNNGAYLSLLILQHLLLKELQQNCLNTLNYFRSIERSLTINDVGLSWSDSSGDSKPSVCDTGGLGSHQYVHNTPADYVVDAMQRVERIDVVNHDDFYVYKEDHVMVQDQRGYFIMYDAALADFKNLENELLLVCSHFIQKYAMQNTRNLSNVDMASHKSRSVDRFKILLDIWTNEVIYCEKKRNLLDCYYEVYQHTTDAQQRKNLTQVMTTIIYQRPRIDYDMNYFVMSYQYEISLLVLRCDLAKSILNELIDDQREYTQRLSRCVEHKYGLPHTLLPLQRISVNTRNSALQSVFMLEFHPSLAFISSLPGAITEAYHQLVHMYQPETVTEKLQLELLLVQRIQKCWTDKPITGSLYSKQVMKDIFSDVFIEDPLFVCEVGESMTALKDVKSSHGMRKEDSQKMMEVWMKLLETLTYRHRLLLALNETDILMRIYQEYAENVGIDGCHGYLRYVAFDYAKKQPEWYTKPLVLKQLLDDESRVDRFVPNFSTLALSELDEKHLSVFTFKNRDGLISILTHHNMEKLRLALVSQVVQKNLLAAVVQQINGCMNFLRHNNRALFRKVPRLDANKSIFNPTFSLMSVDSCLFQNQFKMVYDKLLASVVSLQAEKTFYRDRMLNEFLAIKEKKQLVSMEEIIRVKKQAIEKYCLKLQTRTSQHALRGQIIAYLYSLSQLLSCFPVTRDSHFVIGEEKEFKYVIDKRDDDDFEQDNPDPGSLQKRPKRLLSRDGNKLINLWYLPHYTEVLYMYQEDTDEECSKKITLVLRILSALHDICQYLCAHARSGSSHARMGSQKLQFAGLTADWGGSEGIGAEFREIQRQINQLPSPFDPNQVAHFLECKRDVMYLKYDIAIRHCVSDTLLSSENHVAYRSIADCLESAFNELSNKKRPTTTDFSVELPEPLQKDDLKSRQLYPWRSFVNRSCNSPGQFGTFYRLATAMQLPLYELRNIDRQVVHGEILGVSLLLEDVVKAGVPHLSLTEPVDVPIRLGSSRRSRPPSPSHDAGLKSKPPPTVVTRNGKLAPANEKMLSETTSSAANMELLSTQTKPLRSIEFVRTFLLVWSRLEAVKQVWGCCRLKVPNMTSGKKLKSFYHVYQTDVLRVVYKLICRNADTSFVANGDEIACMPAHITEYELKVRQMVRVLELLECDMLQECIRKVSREHTRALAERARDDRSLPTDLWKKPSTKENIAVAKPYFVEEFIENLGIFGDADVLTFDRSQLDECLNKLATSSMNHEKSLFLSYTSFYESLLRQQNQVLFTREQEIKQLTDAIERNEGANCVKIDCGLADKCYSLLVEVTALRNQVTQLSSSIEGVEESMTSKLRKEYSDLVLVLCKNSFKIQSKFEQFQSSLYVGVLQVLQEVRADADEKLRNIRSRYGPAIATDAMSARLILSEQLREARTGVEKLTLAIRKSRAFHGWNRVKNQVVFRRKLEDYQERCAKTTKVSLENSLLSEEKEILIKEEQQTVRKLLKNLEKEYESLRKQLEREHKIQSERSHTQIQEVHSKRHLELARASNLKKLENDLETKENELKVLKSSSSCAQTPWNRSTQDMKRALNETTQQLKHERSMKLEAFERVDELQKQVHELEEKVNQLLSKEKHSYHDTCFPLVPGGRVSPQRMRTLPLKNKTSMGNRPKTAFVSRPKSGGMMITNGRLQSIGTQLRPNKSELSLRGLSIPPF